MPNRQPKNLRLARSQAEMRHRMALPKKKRWVPQVPLHGQTRKAFDYLMRNPGMDAGLLSEMFSISFRTAQSVRSWANHSQ